MNLKDIFAKAENGTLTYEQFVAASNGAKFVDLSEGNYVARQKYTDDLADRDTRINTLNDTIATRDNDLTNLRQQLQEAGNDADKLSKLNADFGSLQNKYDKDTKALQKQLRDQAYKFAVNDFVAQYEFSSNAAKRDFTNALLSKNFTVENDTIIGATDFVSAYTKDNADAFKVAEPATDPKPAPHFVDTTNQSGNSNPDASPFAFNFAGVRSHKED